MPSTKPPLRVYEFQADAPAIAAALKIGEADVITAFRDGRVVSRFSEYWASKVYGYQREASSNAAYSDGFIGGPLGMRVSVKSLSPASVKFQQSKDQGAGRKCTPAGLKDAVKRCDRHLVVDCSEFPALRMVAVPSTFLVDRVAAGALTCTGWKPKRFYEELNGEFTLQNLKHHLDKPAPP